LTVEADRGTAVARPVMDRAGRNKLTVGTRTSALARWQTDWVIGRLRAAWPGLEWEVRCFTTAGDRAADRPLSELGGEGVFTSELERALHAGEIDFAVHSLKDLPIGAGEGLVLAAVTERADARDVLVSRERWTLRTLPRGARVGTCSLRRTAQMLAADPDLTIAPLRGNVDTRIRKALEGEYDAIVLAAAGVLRLGKGEVISDYLPFAAMLPAPGQAALAVQCRAEDGETRARLAPLDDWATRSAVTAERAFLEALGGGCSAPIAAYAHIEDSNNRPDIHLHGLVARADGGRVVRVSGSGAEPIALGEGLAERALRLGAGDLLK
jgi:hydroxymethylbilane synthase